MHFLRAAAAAVAGPARRQDHQARQGIRHGIGAPDDGWYDAIDAQRLMSMDAQRLGMLGAEQLSTAAYMYEYLNAQCC